MPYDVVSDLGADGRVWLYVYPDLPDGRGHAQPRWISGIISAVDNDGVWVHLDDELNGAWECNATAPDLHLLRVTSD